MIRSVPSLATLQRQPNNVTCCTSPPDPPTLTPPWLLSCFVLRETIAHPARESPVSRIPSPSYEFHLSRAPAPRHARAHTQTTRRIYVPLYAWVHIGLTTLAHSRTADRGIDYTRIPRAMSALFFTHGRQYHRQASLLFALGSRFTIRFDPTHGRPPLRHRYSEEAAEGN